MAPAASGSSQRAPKEAVRQVTSNMLHMPQSSLKFMSCCSTLCGTNFELPRARKGGIYQSFGVSSCSQRMQIGTHQRAVQKERACVPLNNDGMWGNISARPECFAGARQTLCGALAHRMLFASGSNARAYEEMTPRMIVAEGRVPDLLM